MSDLRTFAEQALADARRLLENDGCFTPVFWLGEDAEHLQRLPVPGDVMNNWRAKDRLFTMVRETVRTLGLKVVIFASEIRMATVSAKGQARQTLLEHAKRRGMDTLMREGLVAPVDAIQVVVQTPEASFYVVQRFTKDEAHRRIIYGERISRGGDIAVEGRIQMFGRAQTKVDSTRDPRVG
jgi:hypothetical protein